MQCFRMMLKLRILIVFLVFDDKDYLLISNYDLHCMLKKMSKF